MMAFHFVSEVGKSLTGKSFRFVRACVRACERRRRRRRKIMFTGPDAATFLLLLLLLRVLRPFVADASEIRTDWAIFGHF